MLTCSPALLLLLYDHSDLNLLCCLRNPTFCHLSVGACAALPLLFWRAQRHSFKMTYSKYLSSKMLGLTCGISWTAEPKGLIYLLFSQQHNSGRLSRLLFLFFTSEAGQARHPLTDINYYLLCSAAFIITPVWCSLTPHKSQPEPHSSSANFNTATSQCFTLTSRHNALSSVHCHSTRCFFTVCTIQCSAVPSQ